jgi:hypothetical protein
LAKASIYAVGHSFAAYSPAVSLTSPPSAASDPLGLEEMGDESKELEK